MAPSSAPVADISGAVLLIVFGVVVGATAVSAQPATQSREALSLHFAAAAARYDARLQSCADPEAYALIDIDTLLYLDNRGLTRLFVELNGHAFKLVTERSELDWSANAFLIPREGEITISIGRYIVPGDGNCMRIRPQGPPGSDADVIIGDLLLPDQEIAYAVGALQEIPERTRLLPGYPNPFTAATQIRFEVPAERITGVDVSLVVYDLLGRRVRVLLDARCYPGTFSITWDGTDGRGRSVPGGVYLVHMTADETRETIELVLVR